ncbi:MAG: SHOCT domain-containing protein [Candidatus Palauibacterales bacterium]|nr:SHOCT domain-containing protein [Candidatus Palauibacterales bacterium]
MTAGGATTAIGGTAMLVGGGVGLSLAQSYHDFHGYGGGMGGMGILYWVGALLGLLFALALLILIAAVIWRLVRREEGGAAREARASEGSPLEVLEHRYARGEIDREEYLQKRDDLTGG